MKGNNNMENLILGYEKDFFDVEFCKNKNNLEYRLAKGFIEFGSSGRINDRDSIIYYLSNLTDNREIDILDFKLSVLSDTIIMANYRSLIKENNSYALRTSIWKKEEDQWKIYFHQGTPMAYNLLDRDIERGKVL